MTILEKYKENEENNYHSENVLLLANEYGDKVMQRVAKMALDRMNRKMYADEKLSYLSYIVTSGLYAQLAQGKQGSYTARQKFNEWYKIDETNLINNL